MIRAAIPSTKETDRRLTSTPVVVLLYYTSHRGDVRPRRAILDTTSQDLSFIFITTNTQIREAQYHLEPTRFFFVLFRFFFFFFLCLGRGCLTLTSFDVARG